MPWFPRFKSDLGRKGRNMAEHRPHPANVPGDFYVEEGCCIMCTVPFGEAPELFGVAQDPKGDPHCYVKRQPASAVELDQMVNAIQYAETQCIRYRGTEKRIQLRLLEVGQGIVCDGLPPELQQEADRQEAERLARWRDLL